MAQIEQTLSSFYQAAQQYGFNRDYQARVTNLTINGQTFAQNSLLYIKNFKAPGFKRVISTVKYDGVDIHSVGQYTIDNKKWEITVYSDQKLILRKWLENRLLESASNKTPRLLYNPVPDDTSYATVDIVNDNLETVLQYKLKGLFVIDIPEMSFDVSGTGKVQEMKITFGYQLLDRLERDGTGYISGAGAASADGDKPFDKFLKGLQNTAKAIQGVSQVIRAGSGAINALGGVANSVRGVGRAVRGR